MDSPGARPHYGYVHHLGNADVWSTSAVEPGQAFEYWRDLICDTFVQLAASPVGDRGFGGRITHREFPGFGMSVVSAAGQRVRRTPALIARSDEEYVLASIQIAGRGRVEQDGRSAELQPGSMAFYDSTRPYTLHFDDRFEQLVVQVPRELAVSAAGIRAPATATARALDRHSAAGVVAEFFRSLSMAQHHDPAGAQELSGPAVGLFAAALSLAGGQGAHAAAGAILQREQIVAFLGKELTNPRLDVHTVAAHFHVSPRTLHRQFDGEPHGVMGLLRRLRIMRAQQLLLRFPQRSVREIAAECGFAGDAQLHRAFREIAGTTPAAYRCGTNRRTPGTHRRS